MNALPESPGCNVPEAEEAARLWQPGELLDSEEECLTLIDEFFPSRSAHSPLGRGHDCAELAKLPPDLALSTDLFLEGVHFRKQYFTPAEAGAKALIAAVSDLAAAGARPLGFSLGLLLPAETGKAPVREMLRGMAEQAGAYGIALTGGDITQAPCIGFSLCVWGKAAVPGPGRFLRRGEALPGDRIFLIGEAGLARVGLWALEQSGRKALTAWPRACKAHLRPEARLTEGQTLAALALTPGARLALMDLSDGLARDLPRLLPGLGADLDLSGGPVADEVKTAAPLMGMPAEHILFLGGEDYALLGACSDELWPLLQKAVPKAYPIGRVTQNPVLALHGQAQQLRGFDHFTPSPRQEKAAAAARGSTPSAPSQAAPAPCARLAPHPVSIALNGMIRLGRDAGQAGLMAGFSGNISCRVFYGQGQTARIKEADSTEREATRQGCLITCSGAAKARLGEEDFVLLGLPGGKGIQGILPEKQKIASSESPLHIAVYAACPASRAILHTHPPHLLALSLALAPEARLKLPLPEAERCLARLAWTPYFPPGSPELAEAVAKAAQNHPAVWMERHGLVAHGGYFKEILALSEELDQLAKIQLQLLHACGPAA